MKNTRSLHPSEMLTTHISSLPLEFHNIVSFVISLKLVIFL